MNKKFLTLTIALVITFGIGLNYLSNMPGQLDGFSQCLAENEAVFYGAYWCPACQKQKSLFGKSKKYLPYVECSNSDRSQTEACITAEIESYPTWIFKDGSEKNGIISLEELSKKTGCELSINN